MKIERQKRRNNFQTEVKLFGQNNFTVKLFAVAGFATTISIHGTVYPGLVRRLGCLPNLLQEMREYVRYRTLLETTYARTPHGSHRCPKTTTHNGARSFRTTLTTPDCWYDIGVSWVLVLTSLTRSWMDYSDMMSVTDLTYWSLHLSCSFIHFTHSV